MSHVIATIKLKQDAIEPFIKLFKANVPKVLEEKGCLGYEPCMDLPTGLSVQEIDSTTVTVIEKWESPEALQAHLTASHMMEYKKQTKKMVDGLTIKIMKPV